MIGIRQTLILKERDRQMNRIKQTITGGAAALALTLCGIGVQAQSMNRMDNGQLLRITDNRVFPNKRHFCFIGFPAKTSAPLV